jgi:hypothetical protein
MHRSLFIRIMNVVEQNDDYFKQKRNVAQQQGLSCLQKVTAVFRMLTMEWQQMLRMNMYVLEKVLRWKV